MRAVMAIVLAVVVGGCGDKVEVPRERKAAGSGAEEALAVTYFKSNMPQKINTDAVLLTTGQLLFVEREVLRPEAAVVSTDIDLLGSKSMTEITKGPRFKVLVDRAQSIVCLDGACAHLDVICPPYREAERGVLCKYPNADR